ncbi:MAG: hypothetical protein FVQ85_21060 [Planctomycetes bacterium]|nr:hypothetical protein [Planctomycetota bacterium]
MNVSKVITTEYENNPNWTLGENEPKTNPIKANKMPKQTQYEHKQTQFQRQKMLLRLTINARRKPFGSYTGQIEDAKPAHLRDTINTRASGNIASQTSRAAGK